MSNETLEQAVDRVLVENMRPGLKAVVDSILAKGVKPEEILARVRSLMCGNAGMLTLASIEAYLETKQATGCVNTRQP